MPPAEKQALSEQDRNLARLEKLVKVIEDSPTKDDIEQAFKMIIEIVLKIEKKNADTVAMIEQTVANIFNKLQSDNAQGLSDLKGQVNELFVSDRLKEMKAQIDAKLAEVKDGERGEKGDKGEKGNKGERGNDGSPDSPAQIRDKLEKLKGEDRLDASAIKGLEDRLSKLERRGVYVGGGNTGGGNVVRAYDLSASLDGNTRTFALPAFWRIISVHLSSFPNILRPTTDYTSDGNNMTLTLTSEIPDASLASGQTLIVIYAGV